MTISWIQAILLGIFASLSSMPGMGGSSIGNYTLGRPFDRWVDFRFNSWRCDNRYYGQGCPSSRLYRLGNTWWYRICRYCVPSLTSVFLLLSCLCMLITSQMKQESPQLQLQSVQPLGQLVQFFLRYRYYELGLATHWLESR